MSRKNTRNASGSGSIRQRPDGRWEARASVGTDPGTGKPIRRSIYGDTQQDVQRELTRILGEVNDGAYISPSKLTLSAWLDIWSAEYSGDKKFSTLKTYKAQIETHIKPALGAVKLSALKPPMIQKFYNEMLREGSTVKEKSKDKGGKETVTIKRVPMSPKSVRNVHGVLSKALDTALRIGYIKTNPCALVTLPRVEKKKIQPLTDEQVSAFVKAVEGDGQYSAYFKTILFTGVRESEAIGLTWDCIDLKAGTITITKQLQKRPAKDGGFVFTSLKNDKTRVLSPAAFIMEMLSEQRRTQAEDKLRAGLMWNGWQTEKERKTWFVFTNEIGEHLHPQTVYNHYKKLAEDIGAPNSRVHDLRHTFAVLSLQNGDDIKTVQDNLGHATAAFTLDVYGHTSERMKKNSAERMQEYIKKMG